MRIRFKDNIGSHDSGGLDPKLCGKGMELDMPEKEAQSLVDKGLAVAVDVQVSGEIHAIPEPPAIAAPEPPAVQVAKVEAQPEPAPVPPLTKFKKPKFNQDKDS